MAKISKLVVGQVLYKVSRGKMGNTSISRGICNTLTIIAVNKEEEWVEAHYNNMPVRKVYQRQLDTWRVSKPKPKSTRFGMASY